LAGCAAFARTISYEDGCVQTTGVDGYDDG
jgi:hypothetical protein